MQKEQFHSIIKGLEGIFKDKASPEYLSATWKLARGMDEAEFKDLVSRMLLRHRTNFWPPICEWVEAAKPVPDEVVAAEALRIVEAAMEEYGGYYSPELPDIVANAIEDLGGWQRVNETSIEEWQRFTRREFQRLFLARYRAGMSHGEIKKLPGMAESLGWDGNYNVRPQLTGGAALAVRGQIGAGDDRQTKSDNRS